MFVDASALCAILLRESEADVFMDRIAAAVQPKTSPVALYETVAAVARAKSGGVAAARRDVANLITIAGIKVVAISEAEGELALDAFDRFGRGRHPARLNMGDCFAYACAKTHGAPLLFKGDDFGQTDIAIA
jgi:ribonuclease VapC